jgi:hypothetical protein
MIPIVYDFKANVRALSCLQGIPVAVYDLATGVLIGNYGTINKAMQTLTGRSRSTIGTRVVDKVGKDGKPKYFKTREGIKAFIKTLTDYKIVSK